MKLLLALSALLVIASANPLEAPNPAAAAELEAFCNSPGQPCHKVKRIAAALAEPVAEAHPGGHPWCWLPGQACLKTKRDADPGHPWCWLPGQACALVKRDLEELEGVFKAM